MNRFTKRLASAVALCFTVGGVLLTLPVQPAAFARHDEEAGDHHQRVLVVTGIATAEVDPDIAEVSLAVRTKAGDAKAAMDLNASKSKAVMDALKAMDLGPGSAVSTRNYTIAPRMIYSGGQAPRIDGYDVDNSILVRTSKLEMVGEVLKRGVDAGANGVNGINFMLVDPGSHRAGVIREASAAARRDAEALAAGMGVKLVGPVRVTLDEAAPPMPRPMMRMAAEADLAPAAAAAPIEPGQIRIDARVTVEYEFAPAP